jgi:hypothetical protein
MYTALAIFAAPVALHGALSISHRLQDHVAFVKKSFQATAVVLALIAVLLFANGALDRNPPQRVEVTVSAKQVHHGRFESYSLDVAPSWRKGHSMETLQVSFATFSIVDTGAPVHLTVHRGVFGLYWFNDVSPG